MPAASSIYWNSVDSQRSSEGSSGAGSRQYVDPWDLENYAYLRRHSVATPSQPQGRAGYPSYPIKKSDLTKSDYWYAPRSREPGYDAPASVEELYFGPPRQIQNSYYYQQPIYEDEVPHYVAPTPVYAPLSDLEDHEDHRLREMIRRRSKLSRAKGHPREECLYHGSSGVSLQDSVGEIQPIAQERVQEPAPRYVEVVPPTRLGLNTYGHLKIDYTNSWNSLHRKIRK